MMEAVSTSETLATLYKSASYNIPADIFKEQFCLPSSNPIKRYLISGQLSA
jgi:hypothetical protein